MKKELVIMKLGGSIITYKNRWLPTMNEDNLKRFAKEIAEAYEVKKDKLRLILLHGAGSYGHVLATLYKVIKNDYERKLLGFAEIQRLQNEFNSIVCAYLQNYNLPAFPVQASASAVLENEKLVHFDIEALKGLLSIGAIPVLYGVPAFDKALGGGILSGDEIIIYLAKELKPQRIIHVTDVDGVFDKDPKSHKNAKLIKKITRENFKEIEKSLTGSKHFDVTGGMWKKVKELFKLKNIEAEIINGLKEGYIKRALLGEKGLGTIIKT
ncbi:MAG TPA: isopentenyl phosphate kinase family protein [Nanoarchaeota archaeon]|nr:isopentenyl phosphate kinase family protein [Nanoarchaeota archaeon]